MLPTFMTIHVYASTAHVLDGKPASMFQVSAGIVYTIVELFGVQICVIHKIKRIFVFLSADGNSAKEPKPQESPGLNKT
jgi:hypothetical protein